MADTEISNSSLVHLDAGCGSTAAYANDNDPALPPLSTWQDSTAVQSEEDGEGECFAKAVGSDVPDLDLGLLVTQVQTDIRQIAYVRAPYDYVVALPSKGVREKFIAGLNQSLGISQAVCDTIGAIGTRLHNSSLLLDDIQDNSLLRRGKPAAHTLFGIAQTINAAHYNVIEAMDEIHNLVGSQQASHCFDLLQKLYEGQSLEIHWTFNGVRPSVEEYLHMVDCKTGALFELLAYLMHCVADVVMPPEYLRFTTLLGRFFQIRDDHQNLASDEYEQQKGFCEDLDEGKYSLPLIMLLESGHHAIDMTYMLSMRRVNGTLSREQKLLILEWMRESNSLDLTKNAVRVLHAELGRAIATLNGTDASTTALTSLWQQLRLD